METEQAETASDEALMDALAGGRDSALAALMARWERPLKSFLRRMVLNAADADDLAQETFVRIYAARGRFATQRKFSPWLFSIAANLAKNRLRWRKVRRLVSLDAPPAERDGRPREAADDNAATSAEVAETDERARAIRQAIAALPFDLRTVVVLFEYEGQSHAEIGLALGCSAKAVEARLYRARAALRTSLGKWLQN